MSIKVKQHDITDCGAACLTSISAHYKLKLPIAQVRQIAGTDQKGTNCFRHSKTDPPRHAKIDPPAVGLAKVVKKLFQS